MKPSSLALSTATDPKATIEPEVINPPGKNNSLVKIVFHSKSNFSKTVFKKMVVFKSSDCFLWFWNWFLLFMHLVGIYLSHYKSAPLILWREFINKNFQIYLHFERWKTHFGVSVVYWWAACEQWGFSLKIIYLCFEILTTIYFIFSQSIRYIT